MPSVPTGTPVANESFTEAITFQSGSPMRFASVASRNNLKGWSCGMALSFALASFAAVYFVQASLEKLRAIIVKDGADAADSANAAMAELVYLEEDVIQPINLHWGTPVMLYFSITFTKALYCEILRSAEPALLWLVLF